MGDWSDGWNDPIYEFKEGEVMNAKPAKWHWDEFVKKCGKTIPIAKFFINLC